MIRDRREPCCPARKGGKRTHRKAEVGVANGVESKDWEGNRQAHRHADLPRIQTRIRPCTGFRTRNQEGVPLRLTIQPWTPERRPSCHLCRSARSTLPSAIISFATARLSSRSRSDAKTVFQMYSGCGSDVGMIRSPTSSYGYWSKNCRRGPEARALKAIKYDAI
jgi:hypothetical protein